MNDIIGAVDLNVQPGRKPFAAIVTYQDGKFSRYFLPVQPEASFNGFDFYSGLHLVRLYADPGTTVTVFGERDSGGGQNGAEAAISGYLVDCAVGPCAVP